MSSFLLLFYPKKRNFPYCRNSFSFCQTNWIFPRLQKRSIYNRLFSKMEIGIRVLTQVIYYPYLSEYGLNNCKRWWVYGICFYFGNIAYIIRKSQIIRISNSKFLIMAACSSFFLELFRLNLLYTVLLISFLYLVLGDVFKSPRKLAQWINDLLLCAGTICYSIYLIHLPIKYVSFAIFESAILANSLCIMLIVILSCASYLFIEVPFIKFGKRITTRVFK